ncbi:acyl-CoA dehydrogenase family protein [Intestinimonas butyriciproducens]|uniref:Alkylation response protein AidB-like acyl-CoA dehydrogenase n=1 Tax=Intestinimonas butyriciproducens TaxID=1297617 RepID=A0A2U1BJ07_9FIRM|nr:acyl-CoA dehydrogenase family protein [Intestinimonas butyriciproducens]SCJ49214.1 Acyl-CoA dehydrogenase%2C short-chain specific [uncultured Clostridium sp.]MBU5231196.1 acyl-CoA dehydrogenase family protein [Intestinimonas butyriciproducens]MCR1906939.1 acyl-CoA dehydrogenase family protein [Intestinimonas butyriciproducens]MDB7831086.1 acyl-CoA dehydrogenase family protein [Intestinimonas butyriciproducens]MDB7860501.1 acyl-CoA dehydrogenase family protein [Intestinimonas butyriciproduce
MNFQTTKQHEEFRAKVRAFAESEVKPVAFLLDKENRFPDEIVSKMGALGLMGVPYPTEYGGAGLDVLSYAIAVEELSRVDGGTGVILSAHVSLGSWPIFAYGTDEQKRKYLAPLARGEKIGAFGLTEPNAGSDAGGTETTAVLKGDHYILNGGKIFITNAPKADTYVVFAVTTPDIGTRGISAFIVEKDFPGFDFGDHYDKMGIRSSSTAELIFNNVPVPRENLLGKEGEGFKIAMATLDGGRIGIASQALGIAQGAYDSAVEYAKERVQFGKPIGFQQSISFKLADMATKLRCARMLIYSAAELKEHHEPYGMESAMAKMYASDIALEVTNDALQIYGGAGFMKGMDVERAYRDAKITTIYEGTNEIQRVVIASHILGKPPRDAGSSSQPKKPAPVTGVRKKRILRDGSAEEQVQELVECLKKDGHDFTVGIPMDTPIARAERVVSAGQGIGDQKNMKLIERLAKAAGAAVGASRPVAETLKYVPLDRYVGMSGQKFTGNLYIACGISGAVQHLKGIKDASTIVAINKNAGAPIFKNCDYGIVGDVNEILPLLAKALGTGDKLPAPPMVKMKRPTPPKPEPIGKRYVCGGCGYEYVPELGDEDAEIAPGTLFEKLPEDWVCPECAEGKHMFIEV